MSEVHLENEDILENPEPEADTDFHAEDEFHLNSHAEDEFHISNSAPNIQNSYECGHEIGLEVNLNCNDTELQNVTSGIVNCSNPETNDLRLPDTDTNVATRFSGFETLETDASVTTSSGLDGLENVEADIYDDFEAPEDEIGHDIPEADLCDVTGQVDDVRTNFCSNVLNKNDSIQSNESAQTCSESNGALFVPNVLKLTKSESVESCEPECDQESSLQNIDTADDITDSVGMPCVSASILDITETNSGSHESKVSDENSASCESKVSNENSASHESKVSDENSASHESKVSDENSASCESKVSNEDSASCDSKLSDENSANNSIDETIECNGNCDEVDESILKENSSPDNACVQSTFKVVSSQSNDDDVPSNIEKMCCTDNIGEGLGRSPAGSDVVSSCNTVTNNTSDQKTNVEDTVAADDELLSELDSELGGVNGCAAAFDDNIENVTDYNLSEKENLQHICSNNNSDNTVDEVVSKNDNFSEEAWQVIQNLQQKLTKIRQQLKSNEEYSDLKINELVAEKESYKKELEKQHSSDDLYLPQIKELEYTISQQQKEINSIRSKLSNHDAAAKRAVTALQGEMKQRIDQMNKAYKEAVTEKDQMVVKYAQAEKNNLGALKNIERLESKIKDNAKEKESLLGKIKDLKLEKTRLGHELDLKSNEAMSLKKEAEKIREQVSSSDVRIKWAQNKLKAELDSHKDTKANLEKINQRLKEAKEETEQIRRNCQEIIKTYQESEEIKSNNLDQQLKKKETELLLHETESKDKEELYTTTMKELEQLKIKHRETLAELQTYQDKTQCLEEEHRKDEDTMNKFKHMLQKQKTENKDLQDRVEHIVQLQTDFKNSQKTVKSLDSEISTLKISNKDLSIEMEGCRKREAEKLELTEKLSAKNAELQSENSALNDKVMSLSVEVQSIRMDLQSKETNLDDLTRRLSEESDKNQQEISQLSEKLKEKTKKVDELSTKIDDEKDEIKTLKRKHVNSMKDLTRQLQQARRKLETYETNGDKDSTSLGSRTSSTGSLNTLTNGDGAGHPVTQVPQLAYRQSSPPEQEYPVITEQVEPDKQMLIERIVKLQRMLARRNEKIEFIEDHAHQLVDELQKKNKIIQMYTLREETGTLTAEAADLSKAQLARKHSIMGSVYSSHQTDGTMTLDLSLEINRKLQAVLEDTLLKNMTLKESLDTLGEEISRLSQENRQIQLKLEQMRR